MEKDITTSESTKHETKKERMQALIRVLNEASRAYYQMGNEIMPNIEYDRLYDELLKLEDETGIVLSGSPTQKVGYEVLSELPKERHASPMLSLDKTKSVDDLVSWLGSHKGVMSWKMDGLTIVLTYEGGALLKAVTRGNGEIGEVVTQNALQFDNVPGRIPFQGKLVLRGEAVISYADFRRINEEIPDADARYKNPRNLCAGSVRQLDPAVTKSRHVNLVAFTLVSAEGVDFHNSFSEQFDWLSAQGFTVVEHKIVDANTLPETVQWFQQHIEENRFPSDGLVLCLEDLAYGRSLGRTAKFPRNAIAFKWTDETALTTLRAVEWSASRTGLINPVAVFDPVELEGTTVSRASVHNVSIVRALKLGVGDKLKVYKANMIIPQIAENLTASGTLEPPAVCPVCGGKTEIRQDQDAACLYCTNADCPAKQIKSFELMTSRDALNIEGLSEMKLERLISAGCIHTFADLFRLERFRNRIVAMDGFGEKSYDNLIRAAKDASHTELYRMIYGLGIPGIGLAGAKLICRHFGNSFDAMLSAKEEDLIAVDGIGDVLAASFVHYFQDAGKRKEAESLARELTFSGSDSVTGNGVSLREIAAQTGARTESGAVDAAAEKLTARDADAAESEMSFAFDSSKRLLCRIGETEFPVRANCLSGKTFVVTGDVFQFQNRRALQDLVEALGGKATGSVSKKTSFLINNDNMSGSSKNKKAKELGIPIITEKEFITMLQKSGE